MAGQLKTRIQALDVETRTRRWIDVEVEGNGIKLTILEPAADIIAPHGKGLYVPKDQLIGFIIGYLACSMEDVKEYVAKLVFQIAEMRSHDQ